MRGPAPQALRLEKLKSPQADRFDPFAGILPLFDDPNGDTLRFLLQACDLRAELCAHGLPVRGEFPAHPEGDEVVHSIVQKVASQAGRLKLDQTVCLTGGLCEFEYLRNQLGKALRCEVIACPDGRYAGAAGAAITASQLR